MKNMDLIDDLGLLQDKIDIVKTVIGDLDDYFAKPYTFGEKSDNAMKILYDYQRNGIYFQILFDYIITISKTLNNIISTIEESEQKKH